MPSVQVMDSLDTVRSALDRKGFEDLMVTHYEDTPADLVVLHDDHGRLARGDRDQITRMVEEADDVDGLWSALGCAELTGKSTAGRS